MPVNTVKEVAEDSHLAARGFLVDVEHPELGTSVRYPGPPYRLSETPWGIARRAPMIGEHNLEIYEGELGLSRGRITSLKQEGVI